MTDTTMPARQLADLVGDDNARSAIQAGWDAIRHPETGRLIPLGFEQDYIAMILLAAIPGLAATTGENAHTEWAVQVTTRDGRTSLRHADDPYTDRQSAEHYATHARLAPQVQSATVVSRQVWRGSWIGADGREVTE
ncbi:hypothetical protein GCM10011608_09650 [Micromonospora sonchi]|uniref:Uncharacterized protein n=1 Tax=Micromonospora sonchi TaxID=1763543 RepID=A0A917TLG1_9ACTN|nr:hypothetical protein [Micromonospora sonchi]GGM26923.1 hypothetical protein GCM10011608_09650 [Micromonospora sonchi]